MERVSSAGVCVQSGEAREGGSREQFVRIREAITDDFSAGFDIRIYQKQRKGDKEPSLVNRIKMSWNISDIFPLAQNYLHG